MQNKMNDQYRAIKSENCISSRHNSSSTNISMNDGDIMGDGGVYFRPRPHRRPRASSPCTDKSYAGAQQTSTNNNHQWVKTVKKVRFGDLKLREYPIMLGDNPACSDGPPLTMEWQHVSEKIIPVRVWEYNRRTNHIRRTGDDLKILRQERERRLRDDGIVTDVQLQQVSKEMLRIQKNRKRTIKLQKYETVELLTENLSRKMKRLVLLPITVKKRRM